jgi:hypothetical protein
MEISLAPTTPSRMQSILRFLESPHVLEIALLLAAVVLALPPAVASIGDGVRWWKRRRIRAVLENEGLDPAVLQELQECYVRPDCQDVDPTETPDLALEPDVRLGVFAWVRELLANPSVPPCWAPFQSKMALDEAVSDRRDLFAYTDRLLRKRGLPKFTLLLADTGMGKTTFLLNYLAYHLLSRKRRESMDLRYLSLDDPEILRKIEEKAKLVRNRKAVLLLDGLDEDAGAAGRHADRLLEILSASRDFHRVLVTSRTQLWERQEEIPSHSRVPVSPKEEPTAGHRNHKIAKLYVSPLSLGQIDSYLRRRFRTLKDVKKARNAVRNIEDLQARPLLLTHIEAVFSEKGQIARSSRVYELLIDHWIQWDADKRASKDSASLRDFLECLAVELYTRWANGASAKIPEGDLQGVASRFGLPFPNPSDTSDICVRSLLNRDADKNLKFAHRSIMEYLFVVRFRKEPAATRQLARQANNEEMVRWSPEMKRFYVNHLFDVWAENKQPIEGYESADLYGLEDLAVNPFTTLRAQAAVMTGQDLDVDQVGRRLSEMAGPNQYPHLYLEVRTSAKPRPVPKHVISDVVRRVARPEHQTAKLADSVTEEVFRNFSDSAVLVIDYGLGLIWEVPGSGLHVPHELAESRAAALSEANYAGFSIWRLPTIDEVSSLIRLIREDHPPAFDKLDMRIWTADKAGVQGLSVDLKTCKVAFRIAYPGDPSAPRTVCVASFSTRTYSTGTGAELAA